MIPNIGICINSPKKTNRITGDITPGLRIIIPEVVVIQPTLHIILLSREAVMDGGGYAVLVRVFIRGCAAEGFAVPAPDHRLIRVGGQARAAQVVGVDVGDVPPSVPPGLPGPSGFGSVCDCKT